MINKNFWDLLAEKQDSLTKSGTIIADYLTKHAEEAQFLSISSLAKACNMAEATISNKFRNCGDSHTQLIAASLMGPGDVILFVSYSGSTHDMMDTLSVAKKTGAKIILITHYPDAPGTALADVVLLCGALETPLDGGSIPVKVSELFVAESLIMRYLLDNRELAKIARDKTSVAMVAKFL